MKQMKTPRLFIMAAMALAMTACDKETTAKLDPVRDGKIPFFATVTSSDSGSTTKTAYSEDGTSIHVAWVAGDEIALQNVAADVVDKVTVGEPASDGSAPIIGTVTAGADGDKITAIYPFSETGGWVSFRNRYENQDGTLAYIQDNLDYRRGTGKLSVDGGEASLESNLTMKSQIAIWKLTLQDVSSSALRATQVSVFDGSAIVASTQPLVTATSTVYLGVLLPAEGEDAETRTYDNLTIEATVGDDTYTFAAPGSVSLSPGKYYQSTVKMTCAADLSMLDCAGSARSSRWTANCYMVHTAGDYKLPLVYGNAIKDGAANTAAYTGVEGNNTTETFPNHNGDAINAPWITKSPSGTGVDKGMGIAVKSAELLWQDAQGLITAVGISGSYLTLTVGKDATAQEGNAVVAAKDGDGNIVWSWHIWVTKQTFAAADLTSVNTTSHIYKVTPVNLGWVGDPVSKGYSTYYQWGRKDAIVPLTGTDSQDHTVYNISGEVVAGRTYVNTNTTTIADNIKNPTNFYNDFFGTQASCNTLYMNMWDAQQTSSVVIYAATVKTVYDPSPAGFCVPTSGLFSYMSSSGFDNIRWSGTWDTTNQGRMWTLDTPNLFFPALGRRYASGGEVGFKGSNGYYWSASAQGSYARYLEINSSSWSSTSTMRADGYPIRAVAE